MLRFSGAEAANVYPTVLYPSPALLLFPCGYCPKTSLTYGFAPGQEGKVGQRVGSEGAGWPLKLQLPMDEQFGSRFANCAGLSLSTPELGQFGSVASHG